MNKSRVLAGALTAGALTITSLFAAAPASAATLPPGQRITVIDYVDGSAYSYDANPETAVLTAVRGPLGIGQDEIAAVDVNDDGIGYALANYYSDGDFSTLFEYDANTGLFGEAYDMVLDFGDVTTGADYCSALDLTGGVLMAICYDDVEGTDVGYWGIVTLLPEESVALLAPIYQFDNDEYVYFDSMAVNPVDGLVYAVGYPFEEPPTLYTLSQDAGATVVTEMEREAYGLDFDRSGQAWVTTWTEYPAVEAISALATLDITNGTNPFIAGMTVFDEVLPDPLVQPITVWGHAPVLPATGPTGLSVPIGAAALLLLAGTVLAGVTVLRRRQEA